MENLERLLRYAPFLVTEGDILNPHRPDRILRLEGWRGRWLDSTLYAASRANAAEINGYRSALVDRGLIDAGASPPSRLVVKLVNYNVGLVNELALLYPDARFIGILRDPYAVAESRLVRGTSLSDAMEIYVYVERVFAEAELKGLPLQVFRFEDLIANAASTIREVLAACRLDMSRMRGVCLQDKTRVADATGRVVRFMLTDGYYAFSDVQNHMRRDANSAGVSRLSADQKIEIGRLCAEAIARRGYHAPSPSQTL
jgi:hypothetical protein